MSRVPTPAGHTLSGILSRLGVGRADDPELGRRLDRAFSKHRDGLTAFVRRELRGHSPEVVEEGVQEVLAEAWNLVRSGAYRPDHPFRSFLFGIAARKCANTRRKRRDKLSEDGLLPEGEMEATALRGLLGAERDALVEQAIASALDPTDQEIAWLRYGRDYDHAAIAMHLSLAGPDVVRVALQRIGRRLRSELTRVMEAHAALRSVLAVE